MKHINHITKRHIEVGYINIFIPLAFGIVALSIPQLLIKEDDPGLERKVVIWRRVGYALVGVAIIYGIVKFFSHV